MFCNEIAAVRREDLLFSAQASLHFVQLDRTSAVRKSIVSMGLRAYYWNWTLLNPHGTVNFCQMTANFQVFVYLYF